MPRKLRILIVEDYRDTRESLERLLELWGHEVDGALDGEEGLRRASTGNYDALLLDLNLPRLDGFELAQRVAQKGPRPVLIAYSAFHHVEDRNRAFHAGIDVHLPKGPLEAIEELEKILTHLKIHLPD
jgi:two-component system chemotaxis sensor kinase CheA